MRKCTVRERKFTKSSEALLIKEQLLKRGACLFKRVCLQRVALFLDKISRSRPIVRVVSDSCTVALLLLCNLLRY